MPNLDAVTRTATPVAAPDAAAIKPPALVYTADQASPSAAIESVQADAAKGNMAANMKGGWVPDKRGIVHIVTKAKPERSVKNGSRTRSSFMSRSRTVRRGGKRSLRRRFRKQGNSFKRRVSRRIRLRLLQRNIKKRRVAASIKRSNALMMGGNIDAGSDMGGGDPVPQHGASCAPDAPNCAGNAAASLLTANRQATMNAHGD